MTNIQLSPKQQKEFILTQREEMSNQISRLIGFSVLLFITFLTALIITKDTSPSLFQEFWQLFLVLTLCVLCFWGFSLVATRFIRRAIIFHVLISICTLLFTSEPLVILLWIVNKTLDPWGWVISAILVVSLLVSYGHEFNQTFNRLKDLETSIVLSGRLNKEKGTWDVKVPMKLNDEGINQSRKIRIVVILIQVLALLASIIFSGSIRVPLIMGLLWLVILYYSFRQVGETVAISIQLLFWEKDLGKIIIIPVDN